MCNVQPITITQRAPHFVGLEMTNLVIIHVAIEGLKSAYRAGKELIAIKVCYVFFFGCCLKKKKRNVERYQLCDVIITIYSTFGLQNVFVECFICSSLTAVTFQKSDQHSYIKNYFFFSITDFFFQQLSANLAVTQYMENVIIPVNASEFFLF